MIGVLPKGKKLPDFLSEINQRKASVQMLPVGKKT
jgi:hypothetical protein